ncbi:hypothetical protein FRC10_009759 [Ceratobasidium sp. 414]|nr:hypothetical protein FRC10_009759 [Ceratobasidium sp. 414]
MATPISPALKSSARSAYRALFRASGATFAGYSMVCSGASKRYRSSWIAGLAFRDKIRAETVAGREELDPAEYEARVQHAFEVATVLKKNIVQGIKGDGDTYRLRITPDTELGSNDGVKAPYSRPARDIPRLKCGEDPNAVAPLPPKSLRASLGTGAGSTRSYSTQVEAISWPETEYNKNRVQSLVSKLSQVNRRVTASPTGKGKEQIMERVLLEDKLGALAARIEYLAQAQTPAAGQQQAMDAFLDVIWLNVEDVGTMGTRSDPPVQMRQFVRYLYGAGKAAADARGAAMGLSPALRTAIGEEMETPSPRTKNPGAHTPADELRAVIWRMLMVKHGVQRVAATDSGSGSDMSALLVAVRRALSHLTYAQQCLGDLEENGPRGEDAAAVLEEMDRVTEGSVMLDMMRAVDRRMEQGTLWRMVDGERERRRTVKTGEDRTEETCIPRIRQPYEHLRQFEEELTTPPPVGTKEHAGWRLQQLARSRRVIENVRQRMWRITTILDDLIVVFSEDYKYQHKATHLYTAKGTFKPSTSHHLKEATRSLRKLARRGSALEWARALDDIQTETKVVEPQFRQVDTLLRSFVRRQPTEEFQANKKGQRLFLDLKMEMVLAFDSIWRANRRLKHDRAEMFNIARSLEKRTASRETRSRSRPSKGDVESAPLHRFADVAKKDRAEALGLRRATTPKERPEARQEGYDMMELLDLPKKLYPRYSSAVATPNRGAGEPKDVNIRKKSPKKFDTESRKNSKAAEEEANPATLSVLEQNLAVVAAISRTESAVHKLARFSSRLHDTSTRRDELKQLLKKLAGEMGVHKDRSHPIVQCRFILRTSAFLSLRGTVDAIKSRTPKDQVGLPEEQADCVRFEARISEMQMRIVRRLLGSFWVRRRGTGELSQPIKDMLRSARGKATVIHRMVADSMEEFDILRGDEWALRRKAEAERDLASQK